MISLQLLSLMLIGGRDKDHTPTYKIDKELSWQEKEVDTDLLDTTKPIAHLLKEDVEITIHNFPLGKGQGIPLQPQIERWIGQFEEWEGQTTAFTQSGYLGIIVEGAGLKNGEKRGLIAAAFQLAPSSKRALHYEEAYNSGPAVDQRLADCTIKAVGPLASIERERRSILSLIHSFELIDEIP